MGIISLSDYKTFAGISGTEQDGQIEFLLPLVDDAISEEIERDFGVTPVTETRTFLWNGRGSVEIDDATAITQVAIATAVLVQNRDWVAGPDRGPSYFWIELPVYASGVPYDTAMGFTRNEDLYGYGLGRYYPLSVDVTATFGVADAPGGVKLAALYTLTDLMQASQPANLTSEQIDSYGRSWAAESIPTAVAIPARALDILDHYKRRTGAA